MTWTHPKHIGLTGLDNKALLPELVRQMHFHLGVLFAPAILSFSLMAALQLFVLYEGHSGDRNSAPVLIWFFLTLSIGLVATTMLGIYIASKYDRSRLLLWGLLIACVALPKALIALSGVG